MSRELQLEHALRELVATIDLFTDCMDGRIDRAMLDLYIENAEALLGDNEEGSLVCSPNADNVVGHFIGCWIDAAKELPDSDMTVMVSMPTFADPVWLGYHDGERWLSVEGIPISVVAWGEMPEPCSISEILEVAHEG